MCGVGFLFSHENSVPDEVQARSELGKLFKEYMEITGLRPSVWLNSEHIKSLVQSGPKCVAERSARVNKQTNTTSLRPREREYPRKGAQGEGLLKEDY